jgi:hypothetical protein
VGGGAVELLGFVDPLRTVCLWHVHKHVGEPAVNMLYVLAHELLVHAIRPTRKPGRKEIGRGRTEYQWECSGVAMLCLCTTRAAT